MWVVGSVKKSKASSDGPSAFFKGFSLHMVYIVYISITDDLILSEHDDATWMNMGRLLPPPCYLCCSTRNPGESSAFWWWPRMVHEIAIEQEHLIVFVVFHQHLQGSYL